MPFATLVCSGFAPSRSNNMITLIVLTGVIEQLLLDVKFSEARAISVPKTTLFNTTYEVSSTGAYSRFKLVACRIPLAVGASHERFPATQHSGGSPATADAVQTRK